VCADLLRGTQLQPSSIETKHRIPQLAGMMTSPAEPARMRTSSPPGGSCASAGKPLIRLCRRHSLLYVPDNQQGATEARRQNAECGDKPPGRRLEGEPGFPQPGYGALDPRGASRGISGDRFYL